MKLMTLNTHSHAEKDYCDKLMYFVDAVSRERPDVIALQEVNQSVSKEMISSENLSGYCPCDVNSHIKEDNHVFSVIKPLAQKGQNYYWTWLVLKLGYGRYEEGLALMSKSPIIETRVITVSATDDYSNWKTRKILGIKTESNPDEWFFSVHYGWWNDEEEPFLQQWKRTLAGLPKDERIWLMGDFNNPAQIRAQGYDLIKSSNWYDCYECAEYKDDGITVEEVIDGWKDKITSAQGMRIDQIWCSERVEISSCEVVFNGKKYPVVSDHYGVLIDYEGE